MGKIHIVPQDWLRSQKKNSADCWFRNWDFQARYSNHWPLASSFSNRLWDGGWCGARRTLIILEPQRLIIITSSVFVKRWSLQQHPKNFRASYCMNHPCSKLVLGTLFSCALKCVKASHTEFTRGLTSSRINQLLCPEEPPPAERKSSSSTTRLQIGVPCLNFESWVDSFYDSPNNSLVNKQSI